jgi:hypothetical protein
VRFLSLLYITMPADDYDARALALPIDSPPPEPRNLNTQTAWQRQRGGSRSSFSSSNTPKTFWARAVKAAKKANQQSEKLWARLTPLQRVLLVVGSLAIFTTSILFIVYNAKILGFITPYAEKWREVTAGWIVLFLLICVVSFPPLIGYSSLLTLTGIIYGFPKGYVSQCLERKTSHFSIYKC